MLCHENSKQAVKARTDRGPGVQGWPEWKPLSSRPGIGRARIQEAASSRKLEGRLDSFAIRILQACVACSEVYLVMLCARRGTSVNLALFSSRLQATSPWHPPRCRTQKDLELLRHRLRALLSSQTSQIHGTGAAFARGKCEPAISSPSLSSSVSNSLSKQELDCFSEKLYRNVDTIRRKQGPSAL